MIDEFQPKPLGASCWIDHLSGAPRTPLSSPPFFPARADPHRGAMPRPPARSTVEIPALRHHASCRRGSNAANQP